MSEYAVARVEDIPQGGHIAVQVGSRVVAVFRLGESILAVANRCPHKGGSLCDGVVEADRRIVRCPWHHWDWRLPDGRLDAYPARRLPTYAVRVVDGTVLLHA